MSDICIDDISYAYTPERNALMGVNVTIGEGSFCGIIGPNGSGKTTLLKCISGYLHPSSGAVSIGGQNVTTMPVRTIAKRMALVQQHASLEYDFTVMDIVLTGRNPYLRRMQGETAQDYDMANSALTRAGIRHLKDRLVTTLSGGEWQMMILARALCQQADIMLLDEPVTGLDIAHQVSIMAAVKRLAAEQGITVVCVLHDLNLAQAYCTQMVLLDSGRVYAEGTPNEVLTKDNLEAVYKARIRTFCDDRRTFFFPQTDI